MKLPKGASPACRIWIEVRGVDVFGEGRWMLFDAVRRLGSLSSAAAELGMSYRAAWCKVKAAEKRLVRKLLERAPGGCSLRPTPAANRLLESFGRFLTRSRRAIEREFESAFNNKS